MIFLIDNNLRRLCNDNRYRGLACWGTMPGCVKVYRSRGHARNKADKIGARVVEIPELTVGRITVDAAGNVNKIVPCPEKPNHEKVIHCDMTDFVIYDGKTNA